MAKSRIEIAKDCYRAYETGDRELIEQHLSEDFTFFSPPDPGLDRDRYFIRCWPGAETIESYEFKRLIESGDEVIVTYESTRRGGGRFRNTEVLSFDGEKVIRAEVYFGWNLPD